MAVQLWQNSFAILIPSGNFSHLKSCSVSYISQTQYRRNTYLGRLYTPKCIRAERLRHVYTSCDLGTNPKDYRVPLLWSVSKPNLEILIQT